MTVSPSGSSRLRRALASSLAFALLTVGFVGVSTGVASATATGAGMLSYYAGDGNDGPPTPGPATSSNLNYPTGIAVDSAGNLYITDTYNYVVEKVTPDGTLSVIAGSGNYGPVTPGPATSSDLAEPWGIAVDSSGNVYIADASNYQVLKVTPDGSLSVVAGTGTSGTVTPGPATESDLGYPEGLAVDSSGNLYITDGSNHMVLKLTSDGTLSIFAGTGNEGDATEGPATSSDFFEPTAVAVDPSGNVYLVDSDGYRVVKVTPGGTLSYFTGDGNSDLATPGPAINSRVTSPRSIAIDPSGNVYIADTGNSVVTKVDANGILSFFAGTTLGGDPTPGPAVESRLWYPYAIAFDSAGNAYIADYSRIVKVTGAPVAAKRPAAPTALRASAGDGSASVAFTAGSDGGSPITKYQYRVDSGSWVDAVESGSPIFVSGLTHYTDYRISVRAVNAIGNGRAATVKVRPRYTGPVLDSASPSGSSSISVNFSGVLYGGVNGYRYVVTVFDSGTTNVAGSCRTNNSARSCSVTGLSSDTDYDVSVTHWFRFPSDPKARTSLPSNTLTVRTNGDT